MAQTTTEELSRKHCVPCEGGIPPLTATEAADLNRQVPDWKLSPDGRRIRREWRVKDFDTALDFFVRVGKVADEEDHHPDLHLVNYRDVAVELSTHAIRGLSMNDFIVAAKIDRVPVELKR